jgi:hypothetical protein
MQYKIWELNCLSQAGLNALTRIVLQKRSREVSMKATTLLSSKYTDLTVTTELAKVALGPPSFGQDFYHLLPDHIKHRHEVSYPELINEIYKINNVKALTKHITKYYLARVT